MTLQDFFHWVSTSPLWVTLFFVMLPALAWVVGEVADGSRNVTGWGYVYAVLAYTACIPGVLAFMLNAYLFLFERQSIWKMNLVVQLLPVISMVISLMLIKRKIPFRYIPGFGKLSGFLTLLTFLIGIMWFFDRLHLVAFTYVPFAYILVGFVLVLLLVRFAWSRLF